MGSPRARTLSSTSRPRAAVSASGFSTRIPVKGSSSASRVTSRCDGGHVDTHTTSVGACANISR